MFRTHTCGELRISDVNKQVTLSGWVQRSRKMGGMTFIDLRDRYGITQLVFNEEINAELCERANKLGREFVIQVTGTVNERFSKNANIPTGDIEIIVSELNVLNTAMTPPFTIEDNTDGGDDIRMKYRYLDLRRNAVRSNLELRHRMTIEVRKYLDSLGFIEVETPVLIGSTPEGARDFVVPSRMNPGQFYALPQSPQTLKQLLMVSGFDRYFQIAKCFRDEDLRADRQPEFTQIDCEMSFVEQEDIITTFEGMAKHLFKTLRGVELAEPFQRMSWADAMKYYGSDKPDLRFGMKFVELMDIMKGHGFSVFDNAAYVGGICAEGAATYTRKQLDALTDFVKKPQIGAKGMVYARVEADGTVKSSVDKFYTQEVLQQMKEAFGAKPGDLILILSGDDVMKTRKQLCELRLEMGAQLGLLEKLDYKEKFADVSIQRSMLQEEIAYAETHMKTIEREMKELIAADSNICRNYKLLTSIKGVGPITAIVMLCSTLNFTKITDHRKFACYCGLAPFEHSSGTSVRGGCHTSSMANRDIKVQLNRSALIAIRCDPQLKAYYERKVAEGKHKFSVLNAVRAKIAARCFAVVRRGTPYVALQI